MVSTIETIKSEIQSLRGTTVEIFGQPTVLDAKVSEIEIDIIDILDALKPYEVKTIEVLQSCEHCQGDGVVYEWDEDGQEEVEEECQECCGEGVIFEELDALEALESLYDLRDVEEKEHNNSFNWNAPVSNHFDYKIYKDLNANTFYIEFKVHRYGDVRCNYTDSVVLEFDNDYKFLEIFGECNKTIEVNDLDCVVNVLTDGIEVYTKDGEYKNCIYASTMEELEEKTLNL